MYYWVYIVLVIVFCSCSKNDVDKNSLLISRNNMLNEALENNNWEYIFELRTEAYQNGIGYRVWDKESFIKKYKSASFMTEMELMNLSHSIIGDTAETVNLSKTKYKINLMKVFQDTTYHRWIYKGKNWYLLDFLDFKTHSNSIQGKDSLLIKHLDSLHKTLTDELN